jgi:hypothetical protein
VVGAAESPSPAPNLEVLPAGPGGGRDDPELCRVTRDVKRGAWAVTIGAHRTWEVDERHVHERHQEATATVSEHDPAHAAVRADLLMRLRWAGQTFEVHTTAGAESDGSAFHVTLDSNLTVDGAAHYSRRWARTIPRHLL